MVQAQCDVAASVTTHPGYLGISATHIAHRVAVAGAQAAIQAIVACAVVVTRDDGKLSIVELVVVVVAQHHIGPLIVEQRHITQINDIVVVTIDVEPVIVEVVERSIVEGAEEEAQNAVDDGRIAIGTEAIGNRGTIVPDGVTIGSHRRHDGTVPAIAIVIVEAIVVRSVRTESIVIAILVVTAETIGIATARTLMTRTVVGACIEAAGTVLATMVVAEVVAMTIVIAATTARTIAIVAATVVVTVAVVAATAWTIHIAAIAVVAATARTIHIAITVVAATAWAIHIAIAVVATTIARAITAVIVIERTVFRARGCRTPVYRRTVAGLRTSDHRPVATGAGTRRSAATRIVATARVTTTRIVATAMVTAT